MNRGSEKVSGRSYRVAPPSYCFDSKEAEQNLMGGVLTSPLFFVLSLKASFVLKAVEQGELAKLILYSLISE